MKREFQAQYVKESKASAFPDENSALMLVAARFRHIVVTRWGTQSLTNEMTIALIKLNTPQLYEII